LGYIPGTEKASVHLWDDAQKKQIPVWYSMTWLREMNDLQNRCGELSGEALLIEYTHRERGSSHLIPDPPHYTETACLGTFG
jgi:hypothetical protein